MFIGRHVAAEIAATSFEKAERTEDEVVGDGRVLAGPLLLI